MKYDYIDAIYITIKNSTINCNNYFVPALKTTLYEYIKENIEFKNNDIERTFIIDKINKIIYEIGIDKFIKNILIVTLFNSGL